MVVPTRIWEGVVAAAAAAEEKETDEADFIRRCRLFDDRTTASTVDIIEVGSDCEEEKILSKTSENIEGAVLIPVESQTKDYNKLTSLHEENSCCGEASSDGRLMEATKHISSRDDRRQEVLKSMVACGLTESTTSLSIVTAAASAQLSNGNIVALALTNLIAGLFVIRHNLAGRKKKKLKSGYKEYREVMVEGMHCLLHYTMTMLSFLFFGLVPPLVYAFTFRESTDNKVLKLGAVAAGSFPCIMLLAIARTHIQKPENWRVYFKNIVYYVSIGVVAFGLSYLAGDLLGELIVKHGWFD